MKPVTLQKKFLVLLILSLFIQASVARDYVVYSVSHELPMGDKEPSKLRKNYYLNIGSEDGISIGTTMDVFRIISQTDQFRDKKMFNHKVKIGELQVLHAEPSTSIANIKKMYLDDSYPLLDIESVMIGDHVAITIKK